MCAEGDEEVCRQRRGATETEVAQRYQEVSPAPEPAATNDSSLRCLLFSTVPRPRAAALPISTLGPSGPKEFPVPKVIAAAVAFSRGLVTLSTRPCRLALLHSVEVPLLLASPLLSIRAVLLFLELFSPLLSALLLTADALLCSAETQEGLLGGGGPGWALLCVFWLGIDGALGCTGKPSAFGSF